MPAKRTNVGEGEREPTAEHIATLRLRGLDRRDSEFRATACLASSRRFSQWLALAFRLGQVHR